MQRIMNFLGGKVAPAIFWVVLIVAIFHMVIPMLVAAYSEEGEIAQIRRESEKRLYMPAPTQTYFNVE